MEKHATHYRVMTQEKLGVAEARLKSQGSEVL